MFLLSLLIRAMPAGRRKWGECGEGEEKRSPGAPHGAGMQMNASSVKIAPAVTFYYDQIIGPGLPGAGNGKGEGGAERERDGVREDLFGIFKLGGCPWARPLPTPACYQLLPNFHSLMVAFWVAFLLRSAPSSQNRSQAGRSDALPGTNSLSRPPASTSRAWQRRSRNALPPGAGKKTGSRSPKDCRQPSRHRREIGAAKPLHTTARAAPRVPGDPQGAATYPARPPP